MGPQVLVVGSGVLADSVTKLLSISEVCGTIRRPNVSPDVPEDVQLALVLDDAWHPSNHISAEKIFRPLGVPWMRGFVVFGNGVVGPLVHPTTTGCTQCADLRTLMTESERREMLKLRTDFALRGGNDRDAWGNMTALWHLANLLVAEIQRILCDVKACLTADHLIITNLKTLETSRHFILPDAKCSICGSLPDDSPETAVIPLHSVPKESVDSFRGTSLKVLEKPLLHDYLDYGSGLLNEKAQDLITPFAAVSVNLPLMMGDEGTSGRAHSYEECEPVAILEGLERYCGLEPRGKQTVIYDSYAYLKPHALNPTQVGLHASEQYASPDFPFQAFDEDAEMDWVWGYSLIEQQPILVPQRLAYYSLGCHDGFVYETSNGCALGSSLVEAIFHGILEVVERDSFLMTWYARLPLPRIHLAATRDLELKWMMDRMRHVAGYDLHVYNATMEHGIPSVFVIAKNRRTRGLNLLCSAGAHVNPMRALKSAIHETAGMLLRFDEKLESHRDTYLKMYRDSNEVRYMEDHSMLYGLPEAEERLSFLLQGRQPVQTMEEAFQRDAWNLDLLDDVNHLLNIFRRLKLDVIVVNQTSPEIERNGLHCVKVIIPGMLPMTFGHRFARLEHLDRVLRVPMTLGYTDRLLKKEDLNPYPHPFP